MVSLFTPTHPGTIQLGGDGWEFTERVCEIRYLHTSALAGSAPTAEQENV